MSLKPGASSNYSTPPRYFLLRALTRLLFAQAKSQTLLAADKAADGFFGQLNALVGLSFGSKSSQGVKPLVQTLRDEGKLAEPVFGFKLSDSGSEITIGGTNKDAYTGKVTYLPVTSDVRFCLL